MFLNVGFDRQEMLMNEVAGFLILIGFGIQPSTGSSRRSRTEIQQNWTIFLFGLG